MIAIDADVAIEELTDRSHQAAKRVGIDSPFWEGLVIARRIVNNLPTIQPEPPWIPCKNDLPDIGMTVLFCDIDGDEFIGHRALYWWWCVDEKVKNVIAWMSLPEPYKPNKKQSGKEGA